MSQEQQSQAASLYGNGPLRHYYSSLHHHEAVEDYFAPHHHLDSHGNRCEDGRQDSPYAVVERYRQGVEFRGKFIGCETVAAATGEEMCRTSLAHLRTAVRVSKKHKPRVIVRITNKELHIIDQEKEKLLHSLKLNRISYILPDPCDQYAFGFVHGEKTGPWTFYGLKTVSPSIAAIVAVKELFEALQAIAKGNTGARWLHSESQNIVDRYKHGIEFRGKFIGCRTVQAPNGDEMSYQTLSKMRADVLASKEHKKRVVIHITDKDLFIIDQDQGTTLHSMNLTLVTYVVPDPNDEHAFGFIAGEKSGPWTFYGLKTVLPSMAPITVITELLTAVRTIEQENRSKQGDGMSDRLQNVIQHFKQGVEFRGKLIGVETVPAPTGDDVSLSTLAKLRAHVLISKVHKPRVVIHMTEKVIEIKNQDDGTVLHTTKLNKVSYVAKDPNDERAFGFICGDHNGPWYFFGLKTVLPSIAAIAALRDLSEAVAFQDKKRKEQNVEVKSAADNGKGEACTEKR